MRNLPSSALSGALLVAFGAAQLLASCSPSAGDSGASTGPAGSSGGEGTVLPGSGSTPSFGGNVGFGGSSFPGTGSLTGKDGGSCNSEVHAGERQPLDMYFIVDKSGSMKENVTGGTKWSVVTGVLVNFLNDPANADIGTGIEFFPSIDPNAPSSCQTNTDCMVNGQNYGACTGLVIPFIGCLGCYCSLADACQTGAYLPAVPLSLPPNPGAVVAAIGTMGPGGGTPTRPALEGGMSYAQQWASQHPGRTTVIVLATDGDPTGCQTNAVGDVANIAAGGVTAGIRTFVVGVGSSLTALDQVAAAGGTNKAFVIDTAGDVAAQFNAALAAIHGQAASCDFKVPATAADGKAIDTGTVNVQYAASGGAPTPILQSPDGTEQSCGTEPGWFYDNPSAPTLIRMCPASCDALKQGGTIGVELGCKPTVKRPR